MSVTDRDVKDAHEPPFGLLGASPSGVGDRCDCSGPAWWLPTLFGFAGRAELALAGAALAVRLLAVEVPGLSRRRADG